MFFMSENRLPLIQVCNLCVTSDPSALPKPTSLCLCCFTSWIHLPPIESSFPFLLALFSSRLPSSLSFIDHFILFPPKSPARGLFLKSQPHPIAFTTAPNSSMGFPGGSVGKNTGRCGFGPWVGKIPWRGTWKPTPVFLPGESHGERSLAGYSPRGCKESDTTEWLHTCASVIKSQPS